MIVPALELEQILKGEVGETTTRVSRTVGETVFIRLSPRQPPACLAQVVDVWPVEEGFSVLLAKAGESFQLPERSPPERPRLRLTREQRRLLFEGRCPAIDGKGKCPVGRGEEIRLSARVTLRVLLVTFRPGGRWKLHYELVDRRDVTRLLRRTPPAHREDDEDPVSLREASEQSNYTSSPGAAVSDAGEAPARSWLDPLSKIKSEFDHQRRLARHAEKLRERAAWKRERKRAA